MQQLNVLFSRTFKEDATSIQKIAESGSNRRYQRMYCSSFSVIGVYGESIRENKAFIAMSQHFKQCNINVPRVLAVSEDFHYYITDDLGQISLFDCLNQKDILPLLQKTISQLPVIQFEAGKTLDYSVCFPQSEFNKRTVFWDLNYFKYEFLKPSGIEFDEELLENEFELVSDILLKENDNTFMYRDFQSRNVMIKDGEPWFIDFQGGRKGPIYYDLASFIYQAKAKFSEDTKESLIKTYLEALKPYRDISFDKFKKEFSYFVLFRVLQTLGAYGFRGLIEHKSHFIQSIPYAIANLKQTLNTYSFSEFPYLKKLLEQLINKYQISETTDSDQLIVRVFSFSYKKGIPDDYSGNGGGFVFDCRALHNPGRYDEYKQLTGLDKPVIDFIENNGEMQLFLNNVFAIADSSVERYIKRGFTNLMFSFGCTGGRHRSVYAAQKLAEHISKKYGVKVALTHREQSIMTSL